MKKRFSMVCMAILLVLAVNVKAQYVISSPWNLTGNSLNTSTANSFLGTTNSYPLIFKTNNAMRMSIDAEGKVGINTSTPYQMLHIVNGNV